jgi:hypothetical protein
VPKSYAATLLCVQWMCAVHGYMGEVRRLGSLQERLLCVPKSHAATFLCVQ